MNEKWKSRKLLITIVVILVIAGADIAGIGLEEQTVDAILKATLGLVGAQGLVDTAGAFSAGRKIADAVKDVEGELDE